MSALTMHGQVVVILQGRYAGKKAVVVRSMYYDKTENDLRRQRNEILDTIH